MERPCFETGVTSSGEAAIIALLYIKARNINTHENPQQT